MRRMMASWVIFAVLIASLILMVTEDRVEGKIQKATLSKGSRLSFTYDIRNVEGTATRTGTLTATVTELEWRGYDSFMFNGTISGTFWTQSGSGSESGTWQEYYRQGDLSFLDQTYVTDMVIGTNTVTNTTNLHHSPSLTWIEFPLEYVNGPDKSIWSTSSPVTVMSTWERIINGDEQTSESGSENEELDYDWICADLVTKDVGAASFQTYWIREWVRDDAPRNQVTDYFYNETVGWWVQKDVYVDDDQGEQVRVRHYELAGSAVNRGPSVVGDPKVTMNEDTTDSSVDLDYVFSDPEGDPLTYKVVESGALAASIDQEDRLVVKPPKDLFGKWNVTVSAQDAINPAIDLDIPVEVRPVDDPPVLTDPSLSPLSGDETTLFTYSIKVTDIDSAEPSSADVLVDSYRFDMTKISGDNRTGALFQYSTYLEPGEHEHSFRVDDVPYPSTGRLNGPTVNAREDPFLKQGGVSPSEGDVDTDFTFSVVWVGPNGESPGSVVLVLDGTIMTLTGDGSDPVNGRSFSISLKLTEGAHSYHFEAFLGSDQYRFPQSGNLFGPDVAGLEGPYLSGGKVSPIEGGLSTDFVFEVTWTGPNGESPSRTEVVLDGKASTLAKKSGSPTGGLVYGVAMKVGEGDHSFHFRASFGTEELRFPKVGDIDGPTVSPPVLLGYGYFLRNERDGQATYLFHVTYGYPIEVYPSEAQVEIDGTGHVLAETSGSPLTGLNCSGEVTLAQGNYSIVFRLVVDGVTLVSQSDVLRVRFAPDVTPDDTDDDDPSDGSDGSELAIIILISVMVLVILVALLAFFMMGRRGRGHKEAGSELDEEYVINTYGRMK